MQANIHSFLEFDDRIGVVLKFMDEAISELDNMDSLVSSYKIHLNVMFLFYPFSMHLTLHYNRLSATIFYTFNPRIGAYRSRLRIKEHC